MGKVHVHELDICFFFPFFNASDQKLARWAELSSLFIAKSDGASIEFDEVEDN